jgi:hypothetical protein
MLDWLVSDSSEPVFLRRSLDFSSSPGERATDPRECRRPADLTLPYPYDFPPKGVQLPANPSVACAVALNFCTPEVSVVPRGRVTGGTAMPKAAVNKQCDTVLRPSKVGPPRKRQMTPPPF